MSQYQDYFYSEASQEADFSILQSPYVEQDRLDEFRFLMDNRFYKQLVPTEEYPEFTETPSTPVNPPQIQELSPLVANRRAKRVIHTTEYQKQVRKLIAKGLKDDTTELNINLKTILHNKLKELSLTREFCYNQTEIIKAYSKEIAQFRAIKRLSKSQRIKEKSLQLIKSPRMAIQIFKSHGRFENKLTLIKNIQCVRKNFEQQKVTKWKEITLE